jgi:hypothetical protein
MAALYSNASSGENTASSSLTWAHTAGGNGRALFVFVAGEVFGPTFTGATYAGVAMTQVVQSQYLTFLRYAAWALGGPTGATNNVVVTGSSAWDRLCGTAVSAGGADAVTQFSAANSATGSGSTASVNLASTANDLVIDACCFFNGSKDDVVPGAGQTQRVRAGVNWDQVMTTRTGAATSTTMTETTNGNPGSWVIVAVTVQGASGGTSQSFSFAGVGSQAGYGSPTIADVALSIQPAGKSSAAVYGAPVVLGDDLLISPAGKSSAAAYGSPTLTKPLTGTLTPSGVGSRAAYGGHLIADVQLTVNVLAGVSSAALYGSPILALPGHMVFPNGIGTRVAYGSHIFSKLSIKTILPAGIGSARTTGSHTLVKPTANQGVFSAASQGTHTISKVTAKSIQQPFATSKAAYGNFVITEVQLNIAVPGKASAAVYGSHTLMNIGVLALFPLGVSSFAMLGNHIFAKISAKNIIPPSVTSAAVFGNLTIADVVLSVSMTGVPSAAAYGLSVVNKVGLQNIQVPGKTSAAVYGTPTLSLQSLRITPAGIVSAALYGNLTIAHVAPKVVTITAGVASIAAYGTFEIKNLPKEVLPESTPSKAAYGSHNISDVFLQFFPFSAPSKAAVGVPFIFLRNAQLVQMFSGVVSAAACGFPTLQHLVQIIGMNGVPSAQSFGNNLFGPGNMPTFRNPDILVLSY